MASKDDVGVGAPSTETSCPRSNDQSASHATSQPLTGKSPLSFDEFAIIAHCVAEHLVGKRGKALDLASNIYRETARCAGLGKAASLDDLMALFERGHYGGDGRLRARAKEVWATFRSARRAIGDLRKDRRPPDGP
jgi:hypothetical protein